MTVNAAPSAASGRLTITTIRIRARLGQGRCRGGRHDQGGLDTAATFAQNMPRAAGPGNGMIVRHGQLVHFWGDIDDSAPEVKSVTKSMGGIALGLAIDDGKLSR